ncbi:MAG: hypothetical protein V3T23_05780 [Nitrososphaerales archaeon]
MRKPQGSSKIPTKQPAEKRREYAAYLEGEFLASGRDAKVSVSGTNATTLRITYVGIGRPEAYQMSRDPDLGRMWRQLGFKQLIVSDGYVNSWTIALE